MRTRCLPWFFPCGGEGYGGEREREGPGSEWGEVEARKKEGWMALIEHRRESKCPTCIRPLHIYIIHKFILRTHLDQFPHPLRASCADRSFFPSPWSSLALDPSFSLSFHVLYIILSIIPQCRRITTAHLYTRPPTTSPFHLLSKKDHLLVYQQPSSPMRDEQTQAKLNSLPTNLHHGPAILRPRPGACRLRNQRSPSSGFPH